MDIEENENIETLLAPHSNFAKQKAALARLAEMLEESYILNLPPSKRILDALEIFAKKKEVAPELVRRAKKLVKEYGLR